MAGPSARTSPRRTRREGPEPGRRATAVASRGRLVLKQEAATSRLFAYLIGSYLHRIERQRCDFQFGDFDLAHVSETIAMAGVEPGMRDADFRDRHRTFDSIIGIDGQRAVNATSIASATGMARETALTVKRR